MTQADYIYTSEDISSGSILDVLPVGKKIFITDTSKWYISSGISGSITTIKSFVFPDRESTFIPPVLD